MNIKVITSILFVSIINFSSSKKSECNDGESFMLKKLALGVDLIKINLFPERDDFFSRNGFKDSIFNVTCHKKNHAFNPPNMKFRSLAQNDQIAHQAFEEDEEIYRQKMMNLLNVDKLNKEEKSTLEEFGYNNSNIDQLFIGAFKLNNQYQRIRKERFTNRRIPIESRINISSYIIELDETKLPLANAFQNEIHNLPTNYEDSKHKYDTLISTFGTHFFTYVIFGGVAKTNFRIANEAPVQLDQVHKDEFKNDKPFDFDLSGIELNVDENFGSNEQYFISDNKLHKRSIYFYGGRIEKKNHTLKKWKESIILDPWLIGGGLAPLSRLIKDKRIKKNFLRAMMNYLDKAEILNLKETVNFLEEYNEKDKWFLPYKTKIDDLNERPFINHSNLVNLSKQFNEEINFEIRKRLIYNDPFTSGIYSSSLDQNEKKDLNSPANMNLINCCLIILTLIFHFTKMLLYVQNDL